MVPDKHLYNWQLMQINVLIILLINFDLINVKIISSINVIMFLIWINFIL